MVWAAITDTEEVKCSGNWMGASKLEGEGVVMGRLTIKDSGKDSL